MKSGTTTLLHHLRNHKHVYISQTEMHFFNKDMNYNKGYEWYKTRLIENMPEDAHIIGEKTPTYSYQENVAERIYKTCPSAKLIWVFRNPVERTYSNYMHAYKQGVDPLSFEDAIHKEEERIKSNVFLGYKKRSIYHLQVERFLNFFPKEQMFFILFEELIKPYSKDHVLNDLFHFIGISNSGFKYTDEVVNKTTLPRFPRTLYYAKKWGINSNKLVNKSLFFLNFYRQKTGYKKISPELKKELTTYFEPHNKKLSLLINKDLSVWEKK